MINKFYKTIHNKYSNFFKFFFFLRYLFAIFLVAICLFFLIPKFFNYENKEEILKDYLLNYYDIEINDYSLIEFKIFPLPNLAIKDVNFKVKNKPIFFNTKNFNIFLNFRNIYNYENFTAKKVLLGHNKIILDIERTKDLFNYFGKLKYKLDVQELDLNLKKKTLSIVQLKRISFSNFGFKKNKIEGEIFEKKFKAYLDKDNNNLDFRILKTGIKANFNFNEINKTNLISGSSKISILNNYLKFNFKIKNDQLEIIKAKLKNKNLSLSFDSLIKLDPFFELNSDIYIHKIDKEIINNINLEKILENKEILKKLSSTNKINYNKKKSRNNLIKSHFLQLNLAHGGLTFLSKTSVPGGLINCKGNSLLIEEYPRLNFNCNFNIEDKTKLLKKFSVSKKFNKKKLVLNVVGSLNLLNKKINFEKISTDKKYIFKEEDINFFKRTFERVLFNEGFLNIFRVNKIRDFFLEII